LRAKLAEFTPVPEFNKTELVMSGLLAVTPTVTWDGLAGGPAGFQFPGVNQADVPPSQLIAAACAAKGDNAKSAVVIASCLRKVMASHPIFWSHRKLVTPLA
jgi:hypothetical protein